jgi:hypothetical protein
MVVMKSWGCVESVNTTRKSQEDIDCRENSKGLPSQDPLCENDLVFIGIGLLCGVLIPVAAGRLWELTSIPGEPRSDFQYYFYPLRSFIYRSWLHGVIPFWNPHLFCGYPVIESVQSALWYPLNAAVSGVKPEKAFALLMILHLFLSYGAHLIALWRGFKCPFGPSSIAAALPNAGAVFAYRFMAGHPTIIFAFPWSALLFAASFRLAVSSLSYRWWSLAVLSTALLISSGAPQFAFYTVWASILAGSFTCLVLNGAKWKYVRCVALLTAVVGGVALAFPQLTATAEYLSYSARAGSWNGLSWLAEGVRCTWLETIFSAPLGDGIREYHVNRRGVWDTAGYVGTGTLLSACAYLSWMLCFNRRRLFLPVTVFPLALIFVGFYLMSGGWLPGLSSIREPQRAIFVIHFAIFIFAAQFLSELTYNVREQTRGAITTVFLFLCAVWIVGLFAISKWSLSHDQVVTKFLSENFVGLVGFSVNEAYGASKDAFELVLRSTERSIAWTAVFMGLILAGRVFPRLAVPAFGFVLLVDPLSMHLSAFGCRTEISLMQIPDYVRFLVGNVNTAREFNHEPPLRWSVPTSLTNAVQHTQGWYEWGGYDPLMPNLALARRPGGLAAEPPAVRQKLILRSAGVGAILKEKLALPEAVPPRQREYSVEFLEELGSVSIASFENDFGLVANDSNTFGPYHGVTQTVKTAEELQFIKQWLARSSGNQESGKSVRWYPFLNSNLVHVGCVTPTNAVLVIRSTWLPGWKAVDAQGQKLRVLECNGWMLAIPVTPRTIVVKLFYCPQSWRISVFVALCACSFLLCLAFSQKFKVLPSTAFKIPMA